MLGVMVCSQIPHQVCAKHQENHVSHEDGCRIKNEESSNSAGAGNWSAEAFPEVIWRGNQCDPDVVQHGVASQQPDERLNCQ